MRRTIIGAALVCVFLVVGTTVAFGGGMHFAKLPTISLGSLSVVGDLVGVAGGQGAQVTVTVTGTGDINVLCENKGGNQAPGRNPVPAAGSSSETFQTIDNGKVHVDVTVADPQLAGLLTRDPKAAGCPNGNWRVIDVVDGTTNWTYLEILAESTTNPTYVVEGPCVTNLTAGTISCTLVETS